MNKRQPSRPVLGVREDLTPVFFTTHGLCWFQRQLTRGQDRQAETLLHLSPLSPAGQELLVPPLCCAWWLCAGWGTVAPSVLISPAHVVTGQAVKERRNGGG